MKTDLTKGNPLKTIFWFALPMVMGTVFQQFYNMVDSVVVGKFVGANALAAVGCSWPILFMAIAVSSGLSSGVSIIAGRLYGEGKTERLTSVFTTMLIFSAGLAAAITLLGGFGAERILVAMHTPAEILQEATTYLQIYFYGFFFMFAYNMQAAIFHAMGESKPPLVFLIVSSIVNIVLDVLFVVTFHMGVAGVAWATLIAQGCAAVLAFIVLQKKLKEMRSETTEKPNGRFFDTALLKQILKMGAPAALGTFSVSITSLLVQSMLNTLGAVYIAGYTAANKIDNLVRMPIMNVGIAVQNYTSQNMGAGKAERVKEGFKAGNVITGVFAVGMSGILLVASKQLLGLFLNPALYPQEIQAGAYYLTHVAPFFIGMSILFATQGILKGAGDVNHNTLITFIGVTARLGVTYVLMQFLGYDAIWIGAVVSWLVEAVLSLQRYYSGRWQTAKENQKNRLQVKQAETG